MIGMLGLEQRTTRGLPTFGSADHAGPGRKTLRPWVAKITLDQQGGLAREFLRERRDYSDANRRGTRGVTCWYELEQGCVYEVCSWRNASRQERYFVRVAEGGEIVRAGAEEVAAWLAG